MALDYLRQLRYPLRPGRRHSVLAYRLFIRFLKEAEIADYTPLLERLKVPKTGVDLYVPSEEEVLRSWEAIDRRDVKAVYTLLLCSGLRLSEAVLVLENFDERRMVWLGRHRLGLRPPLGPRIMELLEI